MGRSLVVSLLVGLGLTAAPAAASAGSLYATPSPLLGADCSASSPCALSTALSTAVSGDKVVIGAGTYEPARDYSDEGKNLTVEGAVIGVGRPVVDGTFTLSGHNSRISDAEIYSTGIRQPFTLGNGASADRILAISTTVDGCQIESSGATITNSLCVTEETSFFSGLSTQDNAGSGAMTIRNDTMVGDKGFYSGPAGPVSVTDSIGIRSTAAGEDASLNSGTVNAVRSYLLHHAGTALSETDMLTEEPLFRKPGDYREAAASPSINFGAETAEPGELDLDGNLRKIGPKTDLGAYEFVPDPPTLSGVSGTPTSPTSATVNLTMNPNSGRTYYHVEYGPSAAYGESTPTLVLPAATTSSVVQVELTGLPAESTVHYSVVASSDGGESATPAATFKYKKEEKEAPVEPPKEAPAATPTQIAAPGPAPKLAPTLSFKQGKGGKPAGQPLLDRSAIKLSTGCGPVACNVIVDATVKIGAKAFGTLPGPSKPTHWQAGKQGAIKLRISSGLQSRVRAYLEANPGSRAKVLVTGTFVAADGTKATRKLTIPVRPI